MIYKNMEIYNVEEIINNDDGSVSWLRVPKNVYDNLDWDQGRNMTQNSTGVELRFKMNSDKVVIKMAVKNGEGVFHVYRGSLQGGWTDHEVNKNVTTEVQDFVIGHSSEFEKLKAMTEKEKSGWNSEVVRVIFDRGNFKIFDIIGDIEPPKKEDMPKKTLMCYGSSITHGSNSIDMSHAWASVLAHNIDYDLQNKGMAGSCCMEKEFVDYIATQGKNGIWNALVLELGINVLSWEKEKIYERVTNTIVTIAKNNPDKSIFVISPFYHCAEDFDDNAKFQAKLWRDSIEDIVKKCDFKNVTYINGLDILDNMTLISADFVHPNIYGVAQIAQRLTEIIKPVVGK